MRLIDADALWMEVIHTYEYCDDFLETIEHQKTVEPTRSNTPNTLETLDCIGRREAIDEANAWLLECFGVPKQNRSCGLIRRLEDLPSAQPKLKWIPCSERLPKINQSVLLATNNGVVFIGHRTKPELIWQVTEEDGRKHWVYDPEAYTDDIEILPKGEDCAFDNESQYEDGALSVTSANYNPRFEGVVAWMPLPKPYKGGEQDG